MASGRHGRYYNDFSENEADVDVTKREIPYSKVEYERLKNGNHHNHDRVRNMARNGRDRGSVRHKDVKERELVNGRGYHSASNKNNDSPGGNGDRGLMHHENPLRVRDREPGELSSDSGSDDAIDVEINGKSDRDYKIEETSDSHSPIKKRKFSPIVWDRDDKEVGNISKSRFSTPNSFPSAVEETSTLKDNNKIQIKEQSRGDAPVDIETHDSNGFEALVGLSSSPIHKEHMVLSSSLEEENLSYVQKPEDDDYIPAHNIRSSRWANDADSPFDEGELSDHLDNKKIQRLRKMPLGSRKQSLSPETEETTARSSGSYENNYNIRSSSSDDLPKKDYMEIDEDHNNNSPSISQSDSDSENELQPLCPLPQRSVDMLQGCRSVNEFERLNKIDEGTYGVVFRAKDKKTGEIVALKKVKMEKEREGFPLTSLREINILLSFHHPSVVDVKEVVIGSNLDSIFMVMEYMEHDLKALMETMKQPFSQSEVKCLMLQLLDGTKYLHDNWVLHRDLKTSNLLLNNRGELKICDFGLSRQYGSPLKPYTHLVVTLWYRAPELLLGAKQYSTAIDMWSLGCIMAELLAKQALFNGKTEFDQLDKIFKTLGTPNETIWPGFSKLPGVKINFVKQQYNLLRRKFPATSFTGSPVLSDAGFDLLNKLLTYDPEKRITAEAALNHEWFREVPLPKSKDFMPTFPAHHAQDRRVRRVMKSPDPLEEQRIKELQQAKSGTGGLFG